LEPVSNFLPGYRAPLLSNRYRLKGVVRSLLGIIRGLFRLKYKNGN
jgi:hypothetical protein